MLFHFHRSVRMIGLLAVSFLSVQDETIKRSYTHTCKPLSSESSHALCVLLLSESIICVLLRFKRISFLFSLSLSLENVRALSWAGWWCQLSFVHPHRDSEINIPAATWKISLLNSVWAHTQSKWQEESLACSPYLLFDVQVCVQ